MSAAKHNFPEIQMNRSAPIGIGVLFFLTCYIPLLSAQSFYDIQTVNTIEITFEADNWDQLLDNLMAAGQEERLVGTAIINGTFFDSVGVRYKGNSSYNSNQVKNPFNIKLDTIFEDQEIDGFGTLKLANCFKDPSFVREPLWYEIARKYFPASLSNYANVYVNNSYIGLYTSNQDVDKFFSRTHFSTDDNVRFKGEIGDLPPGSMGGVWEYFGTDSTDYLDYYHIESDTGWNTLIGFLDTLNNHNIQVDQVLNLDRHLWFLAFQNLLVNLDGPINNPQNHYLFHDASERFNPIPWDLNECFGVFTMLQSGGPQNVYQLQHLDPFLNLYEDEYPVISRILDQPENQRVYIAHMKTILDENFSNGWYLDRALEIQEIIDGDVQADPNKFYSYSEFTNNIYSSVGGGGGPGSSAIVGITQLMETRIDYLSSELEFQAAAPIVLSVSCSPNDPEPGTEILFLAEVSNADEVYLSLRTDHLSVFEKLEMFDDGAHDDGLPNDGQYGVTVTPDAGYLEYYLFAQNQDAAAFLPVRAEYEFFTVNMTPTIAVNEFLAANDTSHADEFGEFDDWIELYNTRDTPVDLSGYTLTDDLDEPGKWPLPEVEIPAGGYLLFWADNDTIQGDFHCSFKLSAGGETLALFRDDGTLADHIDFGPQTTDVSFGRISDGAAEWQYFESPTPGSANIDLLSLTETDWIPQQFKIHPPYPNPFNPSTAIGFEIPAAGNVEISIYNMQGRLIHDIKLDQRSLSPGYNEYLWNADGFPSGIYIVKLQYKHYMSSQKAILIK